jgi:hypothetical protein
VTAVVRCAMSQRCPNHAWTGAAYHALAEAFEQFSVFTVDYSCGDTPGLCASREENGAMLKNGNRLRRWQEALSSLRGLRYRRMATTPA